MEHPSQEEGIPAAAPLYDHPILTWDGGSREFYLRAIESQYHGIRTSGQEGYDKVRWKFDFIDYTPRVEDLILEAYHVDEKGKSLGSTRSMRGSCVRLRGFTIDKLALLYKEREWDSVPSWIIESLTKIEFGRYRGIFRFSHELANNPRAETLFSKRSEPEVSGIRLEYFDFKARTETDTDEHSGTLEEFYNLGGGSGVEKVTGIDPSLVTTIWEIETALARAVDRLTQETLDQFAPTAATAQTD